MFIRTINRKWGGGNPKKVGFLGCAQVCNFGKPGFFQTQGTPPPFWHKRHQNKLNFDPWLGPVQRGQPWQTRYTNYQSTLRLPKRVKNRYFYHFLEEKPQYSVQNGHFLGSPPPPPPSRSVKNGTFLPFWGVSGFRGVPKMAPSKTSVLAPVFLTCQKIGVGALKKIIFFRHLFFSSGRQNSFFIRTTKKICCSRKNFQATRKKQHVDLYLKTG